MSSLRESKVFLATTNIKIQRHNDAVSNIRDVVLSGPTLSEKEQALLSIAYNKVQHALRDSWRALSALEESNTEEGPEDRALLFQECRQKIESELEVHCQDLLNLIDDHVLPAAELVETKVFCYKMKGDYNRYIAECTSGQGRQTRVAAALDCYEAGLKLATANLTPFDANRLSLVLNCAVFHYDLLGSVDAAIQLTETTLADAAPGLDSLPGDHDSKHIASLLRSNLDVWTAAGGEPLNK